MLRTFVLFPMLLLLAAGLAAPPAIDERSPSALVAWLTEQQQQQQQRLGLTPEYAAEQGVTLALLREWLADPQTFLGELRAAGLGTAASRTGLLRALRSSASAPVPARVGDTPPQPLNLTQLANQRVLAIGAHPDDIEAMMGGTINQLRALNARISYLIVTNGDAGGQCYNATDTFACPSEELAYVRRNEQLAAAQVLGVAPEDVQFLNHHDAMLTSVPEQDVRREIAAWVRKFRPFAVFAWFQQPDFSAPPGADRLPTAWGDLGYHPDHMASGRLAFDACVGPSAGDGKVFPELLLAGLQPWSPQQYYMFRVGINMDRYVSLGADDLSAKTLALSRHQSQYPPALLPELTAGVKWIGQQVAERTAAQGVSYAEAFQSFF